ncbi:hypothetical protein EQG49_12750 [Periweissella cryptocerci]|uniref:Terminase large subunit gp17-like C-terminal domain-containing protein n=2 Tax=Periweissella cryptocerci TaxID=2506420 RepID=A0A4P6YXL9_9LACO|nr:phage terminase large subunit [Periweissella cryptocerci]QBO37523.1 hypothetical protein EQG49_12750 [Periweissella cryptocerci]
MKAYANSSYEGYFLYSHHEEYQLLRHTKLITDQLQRIIDGEELRLIVEMPPRHGKSASITETFPSYYLMKNPENEVMAVAYSEDLYKKFGRKNRDKFTEFAPKLTDGELRISNNTSSVSEWGVQGHGGMMRSTSILGGATGQGADLLIIDDPVKNMQEALSMTTRDRVYEEYQATFRTRVHSGGSIIVIMTRWSEDDLVGRILKKAKPGEWTVLRLPAIAEDTDDLLGRKIGEPLAPELGYDKAWMADIQAEVGSKTWAALYQQRPKAQGGQMFKRNQVTWYVDSAETKRRLGLDDSVEVFPVHIDKTIQSWDATFKKTDTSDFVAGQVWAKRDNKYFLIDRHHERMGFTETIKAIRRMTTKHPKAKSKYIEDKANGSAVIDVLKKELEGITPVTPEGGKEVRANAITYLWEGGNIYLPHPDWRSWVDEYMDELESFPYGVHDDEVDSMTQALNQLRSKGSLKKRFGMS